MKELTFNEVNAVAGGYKICIGEEHDPDSFCVDSEGGDSSALGWIGIGLGAIALGVAIVATGGIALVPISALGGSALTAGTGIVAAGAGGIAIGTGISEFAD